MVSLTQCRKLNEMQELGWETVGPETYDPDRTPIGGPTVMMNPAHDIVMVFADGSVVPLIPHDGTDRWDSWKEKADRLRATF